MRTQSRMCPTSPHSARSTVRYSSAEVPTEFGNFRVVVYQEPAEKKEHVAIIKGDIEGAEDVLLRVHSECLTGEVLHSMKCDCRDQLDLALKRIEEEGRGVVVYLRQEGRGIGLGNKIKAYAMQEEGLDTVDANLALGFGDDDREYQVAAEIIKDLGIRSVVLMTNNPRKVDGLRADGIVVSKRVDHSVQAHELNRDYLKTKTERLGHLGAKK
ncbi:MAG: GTP cyclohydrolase II [Polyangiales bacterium]